MKIIQLALVLTLAGCSNNPTPVGPKNPSSFQCPGGGYCSGRGYVCGQEGHACGTGDCCYIGDDGRAYGTKPNKKQTKTPE